MSFSLPPGRVLEVTQARLAFDPSPHAFEVANMDDIDANWQIEFAANPALFDGEVMLFSKIDWLDGRLEAVCHACRFATLLYWRKKPHSPSIGHMFAYAAPVTRDGSLMAVRMASHTANAGRVYFAAGSFDRDDLAGAEIDIGQNMRREVYEETGIDLSLHSREAALHVYRSNAGCVIFRRFYLDETSQQIEERVREHIARQQLSEVDDVVFIRRDEPLPLNLEVCMPPLIAWHFGQGGHTAG